MPDTVFPPATPGPSFRHEVANGDDIPDVNQRVEPAIVPAMPGPVFRRDVTNYAAMPALEVYPEHTTAPAMLRPRSTPVRPATTHRSPLRGPPQIMISPANAPLMDWRALIRALRTPDVPLPTFTGMDHEDPEEFLDQCEYYFTEAAIQPTLWSRMVNKSLTGKASKWYEAYRNLSLPWAKFRTLLTQHFAGASAVNKLHIKLYSAKQDEKEAVGVFLQRKYLLALRLLPQASENQVVALLLESLKPSIKKVLRSATINSFEELVERAVLAENDEAEENPRKTTREVAPSKGTPTAAEKPSPSTQTPSTRPPPQCHYCPGRHFHRDCPIIKERQNTAFPGNWRKRAAEAQCTRVISAVSADLSSLPRVRVLLDGREVIAEIDTLASENFVNRAVLTKHELQNQKPSHPYALLAAVGATINLDGVVTLSPVLKETAYPGQFFISPELRAEMILGRPWLKQHKVIHDHVADCIFVGTTGRQRIYLSPLPHSHELNHISEEIVVQNDFPPHLQEQVTKLANLHASLFHGSGRLKQTLANV